MKRKLLVDSRRWFAGVRDCVVGCGAARFLNAGVVFGAIAAIPPQRGDRSSIFTEKNMNADESRSRADMLADVSNWEAVRGYQDAQNTSLRDAAFGALMGNFEPGIRRYLAWWGFPAHEVDDLASRFFAHMHHDQRFLGIQEGPVRLRAWVLQHLKFFVGKERRERSARKRGGQAEHESFDALSAELVGSLGSHDQVFDYFLALEFMRRVIRQLEAGYLGQGKDDLFLALIASAKAGRAEYGSNKVLAERFGMLPDEIEELIENLRKELRAILAKEILKEVKDGKEAAAELSYIMQILNVRPGNRRSKANPVSL